MDYRRSVTLGLIAAPLALASAPASAAIWGSFTSSRIAYVTGPLTGDVHSMLRGYITDHGDTLADPTNELSPEYLAEIDVFYTAMLSDGTGPTAGALGTLSLDEQAALAEFIAGGGTLILTPDSNGFEGPFPIVYDSWTADFGVTDYAFVFGPGTGQPIIDHPITAGFISYSLDGTTSFTYPTSGQILGTAVANDDPFLVLFEPATGFDAGGRMLVVADHNALTDGLLDDLGNQQLAQNIVSWAAGECGNAIVETAEECDDGNEEDGDGCDAMCVSEGAGTGDTGGSEGGSGSGGLDDTAGSSSGSADDDPLPPESSGVIDTTGDVSDDGESEDTSAAPAEDDGESGCSCRTTDPRTSMLTGLLLALGLLGLRRTSRRQA
jgi:MYXO-CTERM domain-containing protein